MSFSSAAAQGLKALTGMVNLTKRPDAKGRVRTQARLLDLVPGRSGPAYAGWLNSRGRRSPAANLADLGSVVRSVQRGQTVELL